jgi:hypothetical protein
MAVFAGMVFASFFAALFGWIVMLLWNWLMPSIFNIKEISYLQAFGITLLAKILFTGYHGGKPEMAHNKMHNRFHRWMGIEKDALCSGKISRDDIQYYKDFWKDEGEKAFEEYLKKAKVSENSENDQRGI